MRVPPITRVRIGHACAHAGETLEQAALPVMVAMLFNHFNGLGERVVHKRRDITSEGPAHRPYG